MLLSATSTDMRASCDRVNIFDERCRLIYLPKETPDYLSPYDSLPVVIATNYNHLPDLLTNRAKHGCRYDEINPRAPTASR
jgi:hypothetical protein